MRSILLNVQDNRCLETCVQVALDLGRAFEGHVTFLQAIELDYVQYGGVLGYLDPSFPPPVKVSSGQLHESLKARLGHEDVQWTWVKPTGSARWRIPDEAALNDVIIMGACDDAGGDGNYSSLAADVAVKTGTPVLLVPEGAKQFDTEAPIVIAWNGSPEVGQALRAALPLLKRASKVVLLAIEENLESRKLPETCAAEYLARHGVKPEIQVEPVDKGGIAATLNRFAKANGASCIVMGVYGHSRFRELILGGVSRSMMTDPALPLLLAH